MREKFEKRDLSRIIDHQELGLIIFALLVLQKELVDINPLDIYKLQTRFLLLHKFLHSILHVDKSRKKLHRLFLLKQDNFHFLSFSCCISIPSSFLPKTFYRKQTDS